MNLTRSPKLRHCARLYRSTLGGLLALFGFSAVAQPTRHAAFSTQSFDMSDVILLGNGDAFMVLANGEGMVLRADQFQFDANGRLVVIESTALAKISQMLDQSTVSKSAKAEVIVPTVHEDYQDSYWYNGGALSEPDAASLRMQAPLAGAVGAGGLSAAGAVTAAFVPMAAIPVAAVSLNEPERILDSSANPQPDPGDPQPDPGDPQPDPGDPQPDPASSLTVLRSAKGLGGLLRQLAMSTAMAMMTSLSARLVQMAALAKAM